VQETRYAVKARRESRTKPQAWLVRKLMVAITVGIMGYAGYVYIGRFTLGMINGGHRARGVALLVVFCILYAWMVWAYARVIFTPPGYAPDYIQKSEQPLFPLSNSWRSGTSMVDVEAQDGVAGPAYENIAVPKPTHSFQDKTGTQAPLNAPASSNIPPAAGVRKNQPSPPPLQRGMSNRHPPEQWKLRLRGRHPPITPVLLPQHRWCPRCEIVKPYRAHHCRSCGKCVLKYDHHCPWVGQCVGARNHKFFMNFNFAAGVFCIYTFATVLAYTIHTVNLDPQWVVLIAIAAMFMTFTLMLSISHIHMICIGQTTVETFGFRSLKDKESTEFAAWQILAKRRAQKYYDAEWGRPDTEGNIWWLGSAKKEWESVMGTWWLGWILPVGRPLNDGLSYPVNPRFDQEGRWRRRAQWPKELQ